MPLSFSPLSGSESPGSISTTAGRAREILIPNLQSWLAHITPGPVTLTLALSLRKKGPPGSRDCAGKTLPAHKEYPQVC
ncbi:hypothetical protein KQQSB11_150015 [Klebsiella quasipneumoniae subsp. quasipneumoniae]|nr:hypothetical protein KQQSB11_150015 [Klebsiella quasipneumoniae subsp. quasipneumoniae]